MIIITRDVVISSIVLAVVSVLMVLIVDFPVAKNFAVIKWNFNLKITWELLVACFSLFISSFFYVFIHNSPKYAIKSISGEDNGMLAIFNALFMPVFVVDLFAGFTMRMWLTKMAVHHEKRDYKGFKKIIVKQMGIIIGLSVVSMAGMYLVGSKLLSLIYGLDLSGYEWTNALLMLSGGLVAIYTLFENVIIIYRHQHASIFINIGTAVAAILIVPPMTISGGILGATIGYVIVNAVRALGYYLMALYYMIKDNKREMAD
jgi:O-antigen/teichoic acid export membrane protein